MQGAIKQGTVTGHTVNPDVAEKGNLQQQEAVADKSYESFKIMGYTEKNADGLAKAAGVDGSSSSNSDDFRWRKDQSHEQNVERIN